MCPPPCRAIRSHAGMCTGSFQRHHQHGVCTHAFAEASSTDVGHSHETGLPESEEILPHRGQALRGKPQCLRLEEPHEQPAPPPLPLVLALDLTTAPMLGASKKMAQPFELRVAISDPRSRRSPEPGLRPSGQLRRLPMGPSPAPECF